MPAKRSKIPILLTILVSLPGHGSAVEKLRDGETCSMVYEKALGNKTSIDFSVPIEGISCPPGTGVYHCLTDENNLNSQECRQQNWMNEGLCPRIYSLSRNWNPAACDINTAGCPKEKYWSNEYYKYPACFGTGSETTTGRKFSSNATKESTNVAVIVVPVVLVVVIVIVAEESNQPESISLMPRPENSIQHKALDKATTHLDNLSCILLTGKQGAGVATIIEFIKEKYPRKMVINMRYKSELTKIKRNKIYLIKDSFLDEILHDVPKKFSGFIENIQDKGTFVIMEARYSWFVKNHDDLETLLKDKFQTVDLSSKQLRPSHDDRKLFLEAECSGRRISLKDNEEKAILGYSEKHCGIPLLYQMFLDRYKEKHCKNLSEQEVNQLLKNIDEEFA